MKGFDKMKLNGPAQGRFKTLRGLGGGGGGDHGSGLKSLRYVLTFSRKFESMRQI